MLNVKLVVHHVSSRLKRLRTALLLPKLKICCRETHRSPLDAILSQCNPFHFPVYFLKIYLYILFRLLTCRSYLRVNLFVVYLTTLALSQTNSIPVCMISYPTILVDPNQLYYGLVSLNTVVRSIE